MKAIWCDCGRRFGHYAYPVHCRCGRTMASADDAHFDGCRPEPERPKCIHLPAKAEPGLVVRCGSCGGRKRRAPVYDCPLRGLTVEHKPTLAPGSGPAEWSPDNQAGAWVREVCVTCPAREFDPPPPSG